MKHSCFPSLRRSALLLTLACSAAASAEDAFKKIGPSDLTAEKVGKSIPASLIGEPTSGALLSPPKWIKDQNGEYGIVDGTILPVDADGKPINFRVTLPAKWTKRSSQMGGSGFNGFIPFLNGRELAQGFATYGSDSGHQMGPTSDWALSEEVIKNLGYMQMKKTHDAVMVILKRVYGEKPKYNYYFGASQGGREALTVAQRYPNDYDGIVADVPVVNLSSLMLAPELIRIQEKPLANWIKPDQADAIRAEFLRQADKLDGLEDGVINNYVAARAIFDLSQGDPKRNPWQALLGQGFSKGQIETLNFVYSRYRFATPLANGVKTFGMWVPNTDPAGSGLISGIRFRGQEGATENAPIHGHLGVLGVTGFLMQDLQANPLDYVEGGKWNTRRLQLSKWLDSTNPDLSGFLKRGGKLMVTIGTNDTLASPGAQLDYFQSVLDRMGRAKVDSFARFFVIPQTGHGLSGTTANMTGSGKTIPVQEISNQIDRRQIMIDWVEKGIVPAKTLRVTSGSRSQLLCSYPNYPKYVGGPVDSADSYRSTAP